jgi:hypothetical protein
MPAFNTFYILQQPVYKALFCSEMLVNELRVLAKNIFPANFVT